MGTATTKFFTFGQNNHYLDGRVEEVPDEKKT